VHLELIENVTHAEALQRKSGCDIFIDNISELGYGVNAIEALALGICTCTSLMPEFLALYPDHPFVEINFENVQEQLRRLCTHTDQRQALGQRGRVWAEKHYAATQVVRRIHELVEQRAHSLEQ
jgi:hypothetical protein